MGNETVLFRHEKTFYHKPGLFVKISDGDGLEAAMQTVAAVDAYSVDYVGMPLSIDGFAVACTSGDAETFGAMVKAICDASNKLLILQADDPAVLKAGLAAAAGRTPLVYAADAENWRRVALAAKTAKAPLAVRVPDGNLEALAGLTQEIAKFGVEDLVLDPGVRGFNESLATLTAMRRLA